MGQTIGAFTETGFGSTKVCPITVVPKSRYRLTDANRVAQCGSLDYHEELVDEGIIAHGVDIVLWPTPEELNVLLPLMGWSESSDTFTPAASLTTFSLAVKYYTNKVHTYSDCKIGKWLLRGEMGGMVSLQLSLLAKTMAEGTTFSATIPSDRTAPYSFTRGSLTLAAATRYIERFALSCDFKLLPSWFNSVSATDIDETDREMFFGCTMGYTSDNAGILTTAIGSSRVDGLTDLELALTRGGQSTTITSPGAKWEATLPPIMGKRDKVKLDQFWQLYRTSADPICTFVHDPVV